jgi:anti-anti-sigma factor
VTGAGGVHEPPAPVAASSEGTALRVSLDADGARTVLAFAGELDMSSLAVAEDALSAAEAPAPAVLVVDLSRLDFVDSSGVRLVLRAAARADEAGRRCALVLGHGRARRLFEVLGLVSRLDVLADPGDLAP